MDSAICRLSLVVLAKQIGPQVTVEEFLASARPRLERALVARYGVDDGTEAADEAIAYAVEHWDRLASMTNPAGYLYRVGQSYGSRLSSRWRRSGLLVDQPATSVVSFEPDLQAALIKLKPDERVAIVLVHSHGHSYAEAAEVLDVPVTTVTNHLNRGLARLRKLLES